jgi:hypothetical protein
MPDIGAVDFADLNAKAHVELGFCSGLSSPKEDPRAGMPLVLLQRILQGWKDMAAMVNGKAKDATSPSMLYAPNPLASSKPKIEEELQPASSKSQLATIVTCGREKNLFATQHCPDMQILHSLMTWQTQ